MIKKTAATIYKINYDYQVFGIQSIKDIIQKIDNAKHTIPFIVHPIQQEFEGSLHKEHT